MSFLRQNLTAIFWTAGVIAFLVLMWVVFVAPVQQKVDTKLVAIAHPADGVTFVATLDSNHVRPNSNQPVHLELLREVLYAPKTIEVCPAFPQQHDEHCSPWPARNGHFDQSMTLWVNTPSGSIAQMLLLTIRTNDGGDAANSGAAKSEGAGGKHGKAAKGNARTNAAAVSKPDASPQGRSAARAFQETILRIGPIHVEDRVWPDDLLRWFARIKGITRDFTLPIVVILLGVWFSKRASFRAEEDQVRRMLLTKVQDLTKSYYIHIVRHARYGVSTMTKRNLDEALFHLFSLLLFNSRLSEEEGGVFFTNLAAEQIYATSIGMILDEVRTQMGGEPKFRAALDAFANLRSASAPTPQPSGGSSQAAGSTASVRPVIPVPRLADFLNNKPNLPQLQVEKLFISVADILRTVTSYELDAPLYEHWYGQKRVIDLPQHFPTEQEFMQMTAEKQNAWTTLVESARLWVGDKPNSKELLAKLPRIQQMPDGSRQWLAVEVSSMSH